MDDKTQEKIHKIELEVTEIKGNLKHIGERLDNGISQTMNNIWNKINEDIMPAVKDSIFWIGWLKKGLAVALIVGIGRIIWEKISFLIK